MGNGDLGFLARQREASGERAHDLSGKVAANGAAWVKGIMACHLGLVKIGMAEFAGQFVAVDLDIVLSGQSLKFGKRRQSG